MATKLNLKNLGFTAVLNRVAALAGYPEPPNGIATAITNLNLLAANQNELIDRMAAQEARMAAQEARPNVPFPGGS